MKIKNTLTDRFDIIGDIHGQFEKLRGLLRHLGYRDAEGTWRHPEGRKVLFLGDFVDRGPRIRQVLRLVRGMVDAGDALAIMGNHEYNAICYNTTDGNGGHLRPHHPHNRHQHAATLVEFFDNREEWDDWIEWMKELPFYLDLGDLRAVHAAWHPEAIKIVEGKSLHDPEFLRAITEKGAPEFHHLETLLKGVELELPEGETYPDKDGHPRKAIRARWWEGDPHGKTYRELVFPAADTPPHHPVPNELLRAIPGYHESEPPVFVGHYWLPGNAPLEPLRPNVACLDFSAAHDGPLVAYRWDGERVLDRTKFLAGA
jgi:hypothetical protein